MDLEDRHSVKLHNKLSPGNFVIESDFWILEAHKNLVPLSSSEKVNSTHAMSTCTLEQAFYYYTRVTKFEDLRSRPAHATHSISKIQGYNPHLAVIYPEWKYFLFYTLLGV